MAAPPGICIFRAFPPAVGGSLEMADTIGLFFVADGAMSDGKRDDPTNDPTVAPGVRDGRRRWEESVRGLFARRPAWKKDFTTVSGAEVDPLAAPDSIAGFDFERDLGWP